MALYGGEGGGVAAMGVVTGCGQGPSCGLTSFDLSADGCYEEVLWSSELIDYTLKYDGVCDAWNGVCVYDDGCDDGRRLKGS